MEVQCGLQLCLFVVRQVCVRIFHKQIAFISFVYNMLLSWLSLIVRTASTMVKASTVLKLVFPYGTFDEAWDDKVLAKKWLIKRINRQGEEVQKILVLQKNICCRMDGTSGLFLSQLQRKAYRWQWKH